MPLPPPLPLLIISLGDVSLKVPDDKNDNNPDCSFTRELSRSISGLEVNRLRCCCCLTAEAKPSFVFCFLGGLALLLPLLPPMPPPPMRCSTPSIGRGVTKLSLSSSSPRRKPPSSICSGAAQHAINEATARAGDFLGFIFCCCFLWYASAASVEDDDDFVDEMPSTIL